MKRSRFSEEQIITILREQEQERRRLRCAANTASATRPFTNGKAKYGGMEASDARRLKALEDENTKLKKLFAEAMLDNAMLRDVAAPARSRNANESAAQCGSSS